MTRYAVADTFPADTWRPERKLVTYCGDLQGARDWACGASDIYEVDADYDMHVTPNLPANARKVN